MQGQQAQQGCLQQVTLRTRQRSMLMTMQLGVPAKSQLPGNAVQCLGGEVSLSVPGSLPGAHEGWGRDNAHEWRVQPCHAARPTVGVGVWTGRAV